MFVRTVPQILIALTVLLSSSSPRAYGQRYLSEFVGSTTLKSSTSLAQLSTNLVFETLDNRRLQGGVALRSTATTKSDQFTVAGTLAQSGNCNVQLQNTTTSGGLNLVEIPFDANSFALVGNANANIASNQLLSVGKYRGTTAVLRPVSDPVLLASPIMVIAVSSVTKGTTSLHRFSVNEMYASLSVTGRVLDAGILSGYNLTLSASPKWTYLVGENGGQFLATRVPSTLNGNSELTGFMGDYFIYDSSGKMLDTGTIAAAP